MSTLHSAATQTFRPTASTRAYTRPRSLPPPQDLLRVLQRSSVQLLGGFDVEVCDPCFCCRCCGVAARLCSSEAPAATCSRPRHKQPDIPTYSCFRCCCTQDRLVLGRLQGDAMLTMGAERSVDWGGVLLYCICSFRHGESAQVL